MATVLVEGSEGRKRRAKMQPFGRETRWLIISHKDRLSLLVITYRAHAGSTAEPPLQLRAYSFCSVLRSLGCNERAVLLHLPQ